MIDQIHDRVILGKGIIGTYLAEKFRHLGLKHLIVDIGSHQKLLEEHTIINSNINVTANKHRNSFHSRHALSWGRGLMMIPPQEWAFESIPIDYELIKTSTIHVASALGVRNSRKMEIYGEHNQLINTVFPNQKIHDDLFYENRQENLNGFIAIQIRSKKINYEIDLLACESGKVQTIRSREIYITLGALESTRLLLNSPSLLDVNNSDIGQNLRDHISAVTSEVYGSMRGQLKALSPMVSEESFYPRYYHGATGVSRLQGFSFLDFDERRPNNRIPIRAIRKLSNTPLAYGNSVGKTLLETSKNANTFLALQKPGDSKIRKLELNFYVPDSDMIQLSEKGDEFKNYVIERGGRAKNILNGNPPRPADIYDSLHPTGVLPFKNSPKLGEFGPNFELAGSKGIFCLSTGLLPRSFSIQPTLTCMAFVEILLSRQFGGIGTVEKDN